MITCVVPAFNSAAYVRHALESIFAQTYRPLHVVVVDDGSTDGTPAIVRAFPEPVELVEQSNLGPAATRNRGLHAAQGELIAFLDADDRWHPEKLQRQYERFVARPEIDACLSYAQLVWSDELFAEEAFYRDHPRAAVVPGYATTTMLAKRSVFDVVGEFDNELWFADATDWFIRAAERGVVIEMLPQALTYHRMHGANLTRRRSGASSEEFLDVIKRSLDRRRQQPQDAGREPRSRRVVSPS